MTICKSALEACKNAEAVVIATEWKEFKDIDWEAVYAGMNKPAFVFDGRLLVDAEKLTKIGFKVRFFFVCFIPRPLLIYSMAMFRSPPSAGLHPWLNPRVRCFSPRRLDTLSS